MKKELWRLGLLIKGLSEWWVYSCVWVRAMWMELIGALLFVLPLRHPRGSNLWIDSIGFIYDPGAR
jgi:hypothetical protein